MLTKGKCGAAVHNNFFILFSAIFRSRRINMLLLFNCRPVFFCVNIFRIWNNKKLSVQYHRLSKHMLCNTIEKIPFAYCPIFVNILTCGIK